MVDTPMPRKDPLAALQRGEALERRASRRFSAYQFAKLGGATKDVPDVPPLPSDRNSSSYLPTKTPRQTSRAEFTSSTALLRDGELSSSSPFLPSQVSRTNSVIRHGAAKAEDSTDNSGKITLYLQVMRSVKKCVVEPSELTIPALRLLFIDKFAYSNSEQFPEIYLQDPKSGIRYELEEESLANDVCSGSLLSLNVEVVDEVKKQIDDGLMALTKHVVDLNNKVSDNSTSILQLTDLQRALQESYERGILSTSAATSSAIAGSTSAATNDAKLLSSDSQKLAELKKDLASVKQISSSTIRDLRNTITELVKKSQTLQAANALPPPGDSSRSFMERCFKKLSGDSDKLLTDVDDLQDIIEALRKDVAQRGVRPDMRKLENVKNELESARKGLESMESFISSEKAGWKKIWERELDKICEEQQTLKLHEDIIIDLFDDLEKAAQTFELVEQCSSEQTKTVGTRAIRPVLLPPPVESLVHAKDAVLNEVVALQPNHERRVEAIERAEKLRKKELQMRGIGVTSEMSGIVPDSSMQPNGTEEVAGLKGEKRGTDKKKKKEKKEKRDKKEKKEKKEKREKKKKEKEEEEEEDDEDDAEDADETFEEATPGPEEEQDEDDAGGESTIIPEGEEGLNKAEVANVESNAEEAEPQPAIQHNAPSSPFQSMIIDDSETMVDAGKSR